MIYLAAPIAFVVALELVFRILEPALPTHRLWYDTLPAVHLRQMRALRRRHGGADIVCSGSSVIHSGLDPAAIIAATGLPLVGYNAALHRGFYRIIGPWLERAVIPILRPRVLVLGVSLIDLNDNGPLLVEEPRKYERSLLGRSGPIGAIARRLEPVSALFRNHRMLLRPRTLVAAVAHRRAGTVLPDTDVRASRVSIGPNGEWTGFHGRGLLTTDAMFEHVAHGALGNYNPGGTQLAHVERIIGRLKRLVPLVVLTTIQVSTEVPPVVPRGQADFDDALVMLRAMAARLDVPLLEPDSQLRDDEDFADFVHCNERGMAKFSEALGAQLGAVLRATPSMDLA